ncbi:MAG: hypothetical protein ACT4NT_01600 [Nitrososphaerota archaeon]
MKAQISKQMLAGVCMLMMVTAALTIPQVYAQQGRSDDTRSDDTRSHDKRSDDDRKADKVKPRAARTIAVAVGAGAAIDESGDIHRSHFRFGLVNSTSNDADFTVKKGQMVIRDDRTRGVYKVLPDTWKVNVSDDRSSFNATGKVSGSNNMTYDVSLEGSKIRDVRDGHLYMVKGKFVGNGFEYELHYLSAIFKKSIPVTSLPVNSLDA